MIFEINQEELLMTKKVILEKIVSKSRVAGSMKGQIKIAADFDEPMSKQDLALWYDLSIFPNE